MIRKATHDDIPALVGFLERHIETSMFLLGNLEAHGLDNTEHRHGTAYFLRETGDGITGVFGATNGGYLTCQLPGIGKTEAQTYAHLLKGYTLRGMTGEDAQVSTILDALPLPADPWHINLTQPLYALDLAELGQSDDTIRKPATGDRAVLETWLDHYLRDTGVMPEAGIVDEVAVRAGAAVQSPTMRLLLDDTGTPIAMSDLNARAGHAVQIGGVFVPRDRRGQGLGGRVVAAQLAELREQGLTRAILFAASPDAAKAYEKIGFRRIGDYRIAMLKTPTTLSDPT